MKQIPFHPQKSELPLLLDGRQNALVRPVKVKPHDHHWATLPKEANYKQTYNILHSVGGPVIQYADHYDYVDRFGIRRQNWEENVSEQSPFGPAGTKLWCKERWWSDWKDEAETEECYAHEQAYGEIVVEWQPSITMPKSACRLWLQVLEVKVCRVSEVTEEMAKSLGCDEGIYMDGPNTERGDFQLQRPFGHSGSPYSFLDGFKYDYQSLYGRKSWESDSWIWYATVKRIEKP